MKTACNENLRSHCAVNFGVEIFGDRWSLLIIRDIVFAGKKTYGEFLKSEEGIATNVLASRLSSLEKEGIIRKTPSPNDGRKDFYVLTEKGLDLIPVVLNIVLWSAKYDLKSYVHHSKAFIDRLRSNPIRVGKEVKELIRNGGCLFPESKK
ncbi:winged helix-turn-helix transcriptional regulator [Trabulsiella odontotermitis]|uniref:winged helix-turn-helix transcriptional regulator n=1 Tax=Trabulsiella odontotermitis TaxID=379893 RepID=UPI0006BA466B|nr:helix-turn-helix domain-containing protein [Trabulsiella odontotermitis]